MADRVERRALTPLWAIMAVAALGGFLGGCGDVFGPDGPALKVAITPQVYGPTLTVRDGTEVLQCDVYFEAQASGPENKSVYWDIGVLRWYLGPDRRTPFSVDTVSATEVRQSWGADSLAGGEARVSAWDFAAGAPFGVEGSFRYRDLTGVSATASFDFSCGPQVPRGGSAPPVIDRFTVSPTAGDLEPGDTIRIRVQARSEVGVWKILVHTADAFERQQEVSIPSFDRILDFDLEVVVPYGAELGSPVAVWVDVLDAALQMTREGPSLTPPLVDRTPPTYTQELSSGRYGVGDTLEIGVYALDNHQVHSFVYELGQPAVVRDSLRMEAGWNFIRREVPPGWEGRPTLTSYMRDAAGNVSEGQPEVTELHIFPTLRLPENARSFPGSVDDVAVDEKRKRLYLNNLHYGRVEVVSLSPLALESPIDLGARGGGLDLTAGGDTLVVTLPEHGELVLIPLEEGQGSPSRLPLALDTALDHRPAAVRITGDDRALVVLTSDGPQGGRLLEYDLVTQQQRVREEVSIDLYDGRGTTLLRSADRGLFLLRHVYTVPGLIRSYDPLSDAFGTSRETDFARTLALDAAGEAILSGSELLDRDLALRGTFAFFPMEVPPAFGTISPDGETLFFDVNKGVYRVRAADLQLIDRLDTDLQTLLTEFLLSADGGRLLIVGSQAVLGGSASGSFIGTEIRVIELW